MRKDILQILMGSAETKENAASANQLKASAEGNAWWGAATNLLNVAQDAAQNIARKTASAAQTAGQAAGLVSEDPGAKAIELVSQRLQTSNQASPPARLSPNEQLMVVETMLDNQAGKSNNSAHVKFIQILDHLRRANGNTTRIKADDLIDALNKLRLSDMLSADNFIALIKTADLSKEVGRIISEESKNRAQEESDEDSSSAESAFSEPDPSFEDEPTFQWPSRPASEPPVSLDQEKSRELENEIHALEEDGKQILGLREKNDYKNFVLAAANWQKEYKKFKAANNINAGNAGDYQALEKLSAQFSSLGKRLAEVAKRQKNRQSESSQDSEVRVDLSRSSDDLPPLPTTPTSDSEDETLDDLPPLPTPRTSGEFENISSEDSGADIRRSSSVSNAPSRSIPDLDKLNQELDSMINSAKSSSSEDEDIVDDEQLFSEVDASKSNQEKINAEKIMWQKKADSMLAKMDTIVNQSAKASSGMLQPLNADIREWKNKIKEGPTPELESDLKELDRLVGSSALLAKVMNSDAALKKAGNPLRNEFLTMLNYENSSNESLKNRTEKVLALAEKTRDWQKAQMDAPKIVQKEPVTVKTIGQAMGNALKRQVDALKGQPDDAAKKSQSPSKLPKAFQNIVDRLKKDKTVNPAEETQKKKK